MKWNAIIVLLAIVFGILAPPSLPMAILHGGQASIGILDVCHSAAPALSSQGEMPCINECPGPFPSLEPAGFHGIEDPSCKPVVIAFQDEIPPKA